MKKIAPRLSTVSCVLLAVVFSFAPRARAQKPETPPCCRSSLQITADRSVELLVTSPGGLDTGYEPTATGEIVHQIPSSNYYLGFATNASGGSGDRAVRKLDIGTPDAGRYIVRAIGASSGKFTIKFTAANETGATSSREFSGATSPGRTLAYVVHYSPEPGAKFDVIQLTPFSDFSADLKVAAAPPSFSVSANLALGPGSAGFDPVTQPLSLRMAGYAATIPPRSFTRNQQGSYSFDGTIEGVTLKARILPESENRFSLKLEVRGIDLSAAINPVRILLILGENAGAISVNAVSP
jgi:hypothetical protein